MGSNFIGVTGVRGELGSYILSYLGEKATNVNLNIEPGGSKKCEKLVHTIARHPSHSAQQILEANVILLDKLVKAIEQLNTKTVYFISSIAIEPYFTLNERSIWDNSRQNENLYALSKVFGELFLEKSNINGLSLRIPALLESRRKRNFMSLTLEKMLREEDIHVHNQDQIFNSFISPEDIVKFIVESNIQEGWHNINLACQPTMTLKDILLKMKELTKSKSKIIEINGNFQKIGLVDISLARDRFGFQPSNPEISIENWILGKLQYPRFF